MTRDLRPVLLGLLTLGLALLAALPMAASQEDAPPTSQGGVLVRVDGNVTVGPNETFQVVMLFGEDSHLDFAGRAEVIVIVGGTLNLTGNVTEQLVLVNAHADLRNGSVIAGDISSTSSTLNREPGARIDGVIEQGRGIRIAPIFGVVFGLIFFVGVPIAVLLAAYGSLALFPRQVQTVGRTMTKDIGHTLVAFLAVWILVPMVGILAMFTLIGIPTGFGILFFVLPLIWFAGYVMAGIRLGKLMVARDRPDRRPYLTATVGLLVLMVVGLIPLVGWMVTTLAGGYGGAALALAAWRAAASHRRAHKGGGQTPAMPPPVATEAPPAGP